MEPLKTVVELDMTPCNCNVYGLNGLAKIYATS